MKRSATAGLMFGGCDELLAFSEPSIDNSLRNACTLEAYAYTELTVRRGGAEEREVEGVLSNAFTG